MRLGAPGAEPVAPEEHRKIRRRHALVGVDQAPARRVHDMRQLRAAGPADPVMRAVAAVDRGTAVAGAADRHAPGLEHADGSAVGDQQVLHRRGDFFRGRAGLGDIGGAVEGEQARRPPVSPPIRLAAASARTWLSGDDVGDRSLITGPCRVVRTVITTSPMPRTPMRSSRRVNGQRPVGATVMAGVHQRLAKDVLHVGARCW